MKRVLPVLAAMFMMAAMSAPVLAGSSSQDANTVSWEGHGTDSLVECEDEDPYIHWVLTPGGQSDVTAADLLVDGDKATEFSPSGGSQQGAWHATTGFFEPEGTDIEAAVEGDPGDNALLVISDGCFEPTEPEPEIVEVCDTETGNIVTVAEEEAEDDRYAPVDSPHCEDEEQPEPEPEPEPEMVEVCDTETGNIVTVTEEEAEDDRYESVDSSHCEDEELPPTPEPEAEITVVHEAVCATSDTYDLTLSVTEDSGEADGDIQVNILDVFTNETVPAGEAIELSFPDVPKGALAEVTVDGGENFFFIGDDDVDYDDCVEEAEEEVKDKGEDKVSPAEAEPPKGAKTGVATTQSGSLAFLLVGLGLSAIAALRLRRVAS